MALEFKRTPTTGLCLTEITFGSALTIGTENTEETFAASLIDAAWDLGIRSFDTSNNYGDGMAEKLVGKALSKYPRQSFVLATKGSWPVGDSPYHRGLSRKHLSWAVERSLEALNVDYIDLYYAHRFDPFTPLHEVVRTFNHLIQSGKILYWGTSEWPLEALVECHRICDELKLERPVAEQFIFSFAVHKSLDNGVHDFCKQSGIQTLGFSPLAQGLLTGKYVNEIPKTSRIAKQDLIRYDKTAKFAEQNTNRIMHFIKTCSEFHYDPAQIALQWCLRHGVLPVLGASEPWQLENCLSNLKVERSPEFWLQLENSTTDRL